MRSFFRSLARRLHLRRQLTPDLAGPCDSAFAAAWGQALLQLPLYEQGDHLLGYAQTLQGRPLTPNEAATASFQRWVAAHPMSPVRRPRQLLPRRIHRALRTLTSPFRSAPKPYLSPAEQAPRSSVSLAFSYLTTPHIPGTWLL